MASFDPIAYVPPGSEPFADWSTEDDRGRRWWLGLFVVPVVFTACLGLITWARNAELSGHSSPAQPFIVQSPATDPARPAVKPTTLEPTRLSPVRPIAAPGDGNGRVAPPEAGDSPGRPPRRSAQPAQPAQPAHPGKPNGPSKPANPSKPGKPNKPREPDPSPPKIDWKGPQGQHVGPGKPGDRCADFSEAQKPYCRAFFGHN